MQNICLIFIKYCKKYSFPTLQSPSISCPLSSEKSAILQTVVCVYFNQLNGILQSLITTSGMQAMITSFNKAEINHCTGLCITSLQHKSMTPDELTCFQKCTRSLPRGVAAMNRFRSDSEELNLKATGL